MESAFRTAYIYVNNEYAGKLYETDEGYSFEYDKSYLSGDSKRNVSLTMPLTDKIYTSNVLFPFFDGLIPEGWLLDVVTKKWNIDIKDRFGILMVSCKDCIGNVSVREDRA